MRISHKRNLLKLTKEVKATIAAREAEWELRDKAQAEAEAEAEADARRRATLVLTSEEWTEARAAGLGDDDARWAKDTCLHERRVRITFKDAVSQIAKTNSERARATAVEFQRQANLAMQKVQHPNETEETWIVRCKAVDKREAARVRRARWRAHRAYLRDCHGVPKPASYSGTNRGSRRHQKPPGYYKAQDAIRQMRADLLMLEFMDGQKITLEAQVRRMRRLQNEKWAADVEITLFAYEAQSERIRQQYRLPQEINDFRRHSNMARAYADLTSQGGETVDGHYRVARRKLYTLWRKELAAEIEQRFGL